VNLVKGIFAMFRNTSAHAPKSHALRIKRMQRRSSLFCHWFISALTPLHAAQSVRYGASLKIDHLALGVGVVLDVTLRRRQR
jgi:hypothetical protein